MGKFASPSNYSTDRSYNGKLYLKSDTKELIQCINSFVGSFFTDIYLVVL